MKRGLDFATKQRHREQVQPELDQARKMSRNNADARRCALFELGYSGPAKRNPFTAEISVKSENRILILMMRYFYFLMSLIRA